MHATILSRILPKQPVLPAALWRNQRGVVGMVLALSFAAVGLAVAISVDLSRISIVRSDAQHALDAAGMSAVQSVATTDFAAEASNFFNANFMQNGRGALGSAFGPVQVSPSPDGNTYVLTTSGTLNNVILPAFGGPRQTTIRVQTVITRGVSNMDIAVVLDSSSAMGQGSRLVQMQTAAKSLIGTLFNDANFTNSQSYISLLTYADAVKINPAIANNWLLTPYRNVADFDGCMANRGSVKTGPGTYQYNVYNTQSVPYDFNANTATYPPEKPFQCATCSRFPRYAGPFDTPDVVRISAHTLNAFGSLAPYTTTVLDYKVKQVDAGDVEDTIILQKGGFHISWQDPHNDMRTFNGIQIPMTAFASDLATGRYAPEIDYIWKDTKNQLIGKSEYLQIDMVDPQTNLLFDYYGDIFNFVITYMGDTENESGGWTATNSAGALSGAGTFNGVPLYATYALALVNPPSSFSTIKFFANDNHNGQGFPGDRALKSCWDPKGYPDSAQVSPANTGTCLYDNSDYVLASFFLEPRCSLQQSLLFSRSKNDLDTFINKMDASGTGRNVAGQTRNNIGMLWGWFSLDPAWRGADGFGNANFPHDYNAARKFAILLTQGRNLSPNDDVELLKICTNMKAKGITIFTVSFDAADASVSGNLAACATDSAHYFSANGGVALSKAFAQIGRSLSTWRIKLE